MRLRLPAIVVALILVAGLAGCGYFRFSEDEDPTLNQVLRIGKDYLRAGDGGNASDAFNAAIHISPTCAEAKYGLLIARNMQFIALINSLLGFLGGSTSSSSAAEASPTPTPEGDDDTASGPSSVNIGDYIQQFLSESADQWYDTCEGLYDELIHDPDPHFDLDRFQMSIKGLVTFNFGGRLDRGDLQFFGVLNSLVRGVVDIALAHNINADFFDLKIPPLSLDTSLLTDLTPENIGKLIAEIKPIVDLLESLLTNDSNPDFLTLLNPGGAARMQSAGIELGNLFERVHLMIDDTYADPYPKGANSVHFLDAAATGRGDRLIDPLYIPGIGSLTAPIVNGLDTLAADAAPTFWSTSPDDVNPGHPSPFYIAFANQLLTALNALPIVIDGLVISEIPYVLPIYDGPFFADPSPTGIRDLLWDVINLFNELAVIFPPPTT
jgi:hypothetical protein